MSRTISYRQTKNMDVEIIRADLCRDMFDELRSQIKQTSWKATENTKHFHGRLVID